MCEGSEELKGGKRQDQVSRGEVRKDRCKRGQESLQCCGESGTADNVSCVCKTIGKRVGERNTYVPILFPSSFSFAVPFYLRVLGRAGQLNERSCVVFFAGKFSREFSRGKMWLTPPFIS